MRKVTVNYEVMRTVKGATKQGTQKRPGAPLAYEGAGKMTVHKALWMHKALDDQLKAEAKQAGVKYNDLCRKKLAAK